jgi:hypothetical protein
VTRPWAYSIGATRWGEIIKNPALPAGVHELEFDIEIVDVNGQKQ